MWIYVCTHGHQLPDEEVRLTTPGVVTCHGDNIYSFDMDVLIRDDGTAILVIVHVLRSSSISQFSPCISHNSF